MSRFYSIYSVLIGMAILVGLSACKTKGDIRREQEMERLKSDVREAQGIKADIGTTVEDLRIEVARLSSSHTEQSAFYRSQIEELKTEVLTLQTRLQALEQRAVAEELALKAESDEQAQKAAIPRSYQMGKKLYDQGKFEDSLMVLREVLQKARKNSVEAKRTQFLLGEVLFSSKEYASAALEFAEFQKKYPKDKRVPQSLYRQGWAFKNLGKNKEAKLFLEELIKSHPKSTFSQRARRDLKKLK